MGIFNKAKTSLRFSDKLPSETDLIACIGIKNRAIELSLYKIPKNMGK